MITIKVEKPNKCTTVDYSLFISFPYDSKIVEIIRNFPIRFWSLESKEWEIPGDKLTELVNKLYDYEIELIVDNPDLLMDKKVAIPNGFKFKTEPFQHQVDGFEYGLANNCWLLGDEQGLGKTKQVIDIAVARKLSENIKHCLIVCGVNGLKWNWQNEITTHSDETGYILGQRMTKKGTLKIGSNNDKLDDLNNLPSDYFIITNVESLRVKEIADKVAALCKSGDIGIVAIDEIHKCKNPQSQQGKGMLKVNAKYKIAMSGTPLMNTPLDLFIILKWLGYETHTYSAFKNYYCEMGGFGGYQIMGYKHLDALQEQLDNVMLRRLKDEVLDLPEKLYIDEYVDMTSEQAKIYKEVTDQIRNDIDSVKVSPDPLAQLIRLRQATGYTGILSSTIQESAKLDRLEELVEESIENGRKVVIFSNWTQMTKAIYQRVSKYGCEVITGETKDSDRQGYVWDFQNNDKVKVMLGTIGAMGTGLTLTAGTVVIFMDHPWTRAAYDQAVDRCHRIGQNNNITVYNLLCKNTIDERIWKIVNQKGAMADALVDGKVVGNKSELIDYLLG